MFNEKNLRKMNRGPRFEIDAIDMEAEAQGNATRFFNQNELKPLLGRRIGKESRKANGIAKTAEAKATAHIVKATAERAKQVVIQERNLVTR
jgi:hypothetical protein